MKKTTAALFAWALAFSSSLAAMEGNFDRSEEVAKYIELFKNGPRGAVTDASKEIYLSGINDAALATAMKDRLLADYKEIKQGDSIGGEYLAWTAKALAATGVAEHAAALKQVCDGAKSQSTRTHCKDELERLDWHRGKNEIMASRKNHVEGSNPRVSRYLNLIQADDFSYKQYGADRINWERLIEPRVMDAIAEQIELNLDKAGPRADRPTIKAMGMFCKLLGYSSDMRHKDTLQKVVNAKVAVRVKGHAKDALKKFQ
jgi:hypothetical protein